jgi:RND family efflux transporter MFP subunit
MPNDYELPHGTAAARNPCHDPEVTMTASGGSTIPDNYRPPGPSHTPVQTAAKTGGRVAIGVTALAMALAGIFVFGYVSRHRAAAALQATADADVVQPPAVDVVPVTRASATRVLTLPGDARPFYETTLFARTSGYLKKWNVDIGDRVKQGQVLATIETPELDDQLKEAEAKADELAAEVKLSQAAATFAKISYDVSQQERDQKKADLDSSLAHVEASKANVTLGEADVARLQTLESFKQVLAPFDGIITERRVDIGDLVTAGSSSNTTSMFRLAQYDKLRVFVDVPQASSGEIRVGMPVSAYAPEHAEKAFEGTVDRTAGAIDSATRMLKVEVLVDNPSLALLPGTYLQVDFKATREQAPLRIPAAALTMRPSGPEVAVVAADGTVKFHKITIEQDLGEYIEVSHGLAEGDMVALNISRDVNEGGRVIARNENEAPTATASTSTPPSNAPLAAR